MLFKRKNKNEKEIIFRYFNPKKIMWEVLLYCLKKEGWISKINFKNGDKNIFKIKTRTFLSKIEEFKNEEKITILINRNNIGKQIIKFEMDQDKRSTFIGAYTKIELKEKIADKQKIKNAIRAFTDSMKNLDNIIRDELERRELNSYY